ncbi:MULTISPECIES: hypothetical protein [Bacteroidaceae]|uniref:hypothetical protein n=1 Tax=Bacteroidaceae TaxID=815 RepID=UPI0011C13F88|nr:MULTISPECIES: hypothetical protein [Bacteroidaceae]MCE8698150.1 hypothetical protein [Phocaeicola vulgatus]MCE9363129.1 hypothetical protein [Phocaeicola vulgatus]MCM0320639.1 hypothetical protein [Bacteroides fragilis]
MQLAISQEISDVWRTSSATAYVETISSITDLVLTEIHSWNTDLFYTGGISLRGVIRSITKVMYYKYRPVAPHFL